ncbi:MAG: LEA14-like dessication related protein [Cellvibrionaceae bacterium]|jgi:LEA14-like dessication related protein
MPYHRFLFVRILIFLSISFCGIFSSFFSYANSFLTMTEPEVEVTQLEFVGWVEKNLFLNVTFKVKNTNDNDVSINAIRYEMLILGRSVAKDYRDQKIFLKANTHSTVVLPVTLDMVRLFAVIPEALLVNQLDYLFTGAVVVEGLLLHLPFEKKGVLPLFTQ